MKLAEVAALPDDAFLHMAYHLVLGRDVDESGLLYYRQKLARGKSKLWVLRNLARSDEAVARFAPPELLALPDEAFVDAVYVRMLGRNADSSGLQHYLSELRKKGDRRAILRAVGSSEEARRHDPEAWAWRSELEQITRRRRIPFRWRAWFKRGRLKIVSPAKPAPITSVPDMAANGTLDEQCAGNQALKDQIRLIAGALEGISNAQRTAAASVDAQLQALNAVVGELSRKIERIN